MYEELVKDLRENHDKYFARDMEAADAIEELWKKYLASEVDATNLTGWLAEEHAKHLWIPVTERLPEKDQTVLAYCAEDNFCYISRMHQSFEDYDVTHWIPLPHMPKDGES